MNIDIRTVSIARPSGLEQQIDFRGDDLPHGILIQLADGRIITIATADGHDEITVHGPDMETLVRLPLPGAGQILTVPTAGGSTDLGLLGIELHDSPAGAGHSVEADRG